MVATAGKPKSKPIQLPADVYFRLAKCEITKGEYFSSIIERLMDNNELLHLLLENPDKVVTTIRKVNTIIDARAEISPVLNNPELLKTILRNAS